MDLPRLADQLRFVIQALSSASVVPSITLRTEEVRGQCCLDVPGKKGAAFDDGPVILIVEGFVLFADAEVVQLCHHLVCIDLDCDTSCKRRFLRERSSPADEKSPQYMQFRARYGATGTCSIWHHHLEAKEAMTALTRDRPRIMIDGRKPAVEVADSALAALMAAGVPGPRSEVSSTLSEQLYTASVFRGFWQNERNQCDGFSVSIPRPKQIVKMAVALIENSGRIFSNLQVNYNHTPCGRTEIVFRITSIAVIGWISVDARDNFAGRFDTDPKRDEGVYEAKLVRRGALAGEFRVDRFEGKWRNEAGQSGPFAIELERRILPGCATRDVSLRNSGSNRVVTALLKYSEGEVQCEFEFSRVLVALHVARCGRFSGHFQSPHDAGTYTAVMDTGSSSGQYVGWRGRAMPGRQQPGTTLFLYLGGTSWREYVEGFRVFDFQEVERGPDSVTLLDNSSGRGDVYVHLTTEFCSVRAPFTDNSFRKFYYGSFNLADGAELQPCQLKALDCAMRSGISQASRNALQQRMHDALGPNAGSMLVDLEDWVRDRAPIIIHIKFDRLIPGGLTVIDGFLADTEYRNMFETGTSAGCPDPIHRQDRERQMWGDTYDGRDAFRPKYGCLNLMDDPDGDHQATYYGPSYLVLKDSARWRCTMTSSNSRTSKDVLGSVRQCAKMLTSLDCNELRAAVAHEGAPGVGRSLSDYKEVQIHGPVRFRHDIAKIVADASACADVREKINRFAQQNGIPLEWRRIGQQFSKTPDNESRT